MFTFKIEEEIKGCLDFLKSVYTVFGFTFQLHLSTRPEKYLGELEIWDHAEKVIYLKTNKLFIVCVCRVGYLNKFFCVEY